MTDPLKPSAALLCKVGSALVHFMEGHAAGGHEFDIVALKSNLEDAEVREWLAGMGRLGLLPKRRA